jgi:hypothetical protein
MTDDAKTVAMEAMPGWVVVDKKSARSAAGKVVRPKADSIAVGFEALKQKYFGSVRASSKASDNLKPRSWSLSSSDEKTELVVMKPAETSSALEPKTVVVRGGRVIGIQG